MVATHRTVASRALVGAIAAGVVLGSLFTPGAPALAEDDEIVALRESIAAETRARFREWVVTSAEYVDRQTDVVSARTSRALHRVELAQARAHLLNTLGIETR